MGSGINDKIMIRPLYGAVCGVVPEIWPVRGSGHRAGLQMRLGLAGHQVGFVYSLVG